MKARNARLQLIYENVDISADLQPHLLSWTYTDNLSGQADDLQITLEDRAQIWTGDWMPDKGAVVRAKIVRENWTGDGQIEELGLGVFEIDEIELSGPPSTVTIKALSIPESTSLRGEAKNRAWEKTNLSVIAGDIAGGAGLELFYDTDDDPEYDRTEQTEQTDLEFLTKLCNDAGLCLKVSDYQIVIFDELKYEQQDPVDTIIKGQSRIKSYQGRTTLTGVYKSCRVDYYDANGNENITAEFTPPNPPASGRVLVVNERVSSVAEAEKLAQKRLRQENKNAVTLSLTLPGDLRYLAGLTVTLSGWGTFDGKYIITQATHSQQNGYEIKLELRRCLEGY
ncbi:MAG TPA: contractile injection system protein, VgrG/Pvc8 family [Bacillota bacterium]|nr:contractile injection system protein, VgrG/Pvc8 family [Bacillota bacterium]